MANSLFKCDDQEIHLWAIQTDSLECKIGRFYTLLSEDEKQRVARFHFEYLQRSFILGRGVLRILLGRYLDIEPKTVQFLYGVKGKPTITEITSLRFNVSHSEGLALFAITRDCEIGIDVERIRPLPDMHEIARHYFCPEEVSELMSLPVQDQQRAFYLCWTRKEAYIKAVGEGLSVPLNSFQVTLAPMERTRLVHVRQDREEGRSWTLTDIKLFGPYVAAAAYHQMERPLRLTHIIDPNEFI